MAGRAVHGQEVETRVPVALRLLLQIDGRDFLGPTPVPDRANLIVRFAGTQAEASLPGLHARLIANLAESRLQLSDAWGEADVAESLHLRAGKFSVPLSEERITSVVALPFVAGGVVSFLLPSRDTGLQLRGKLGVEALSFELALVNGAVAGGPGDSDVDSPKEWVGRIVARPLPRLMFGLGASYGRHLGRPDAPQLPVLRTWGGQSFFSYRTGVLATGATERLLPHVMWSSGPFGLYAEALALRESVGGADVSFLAFSVVPTLVLTGEPAEPLTAGPPAHSLDLTQGHFGRFEVSLGFGGLRASDAAFPGPRRSRHRYAAARRGRSRAQMVSARWSGHARGSRAHPFHRGSRW